MTLKSAVPMPSSDVKVLKSHMSKELSVRVLRAESIMCVKVHHIRGTMLHFGKYMLERHGTFTMWHKHSSYIYTGVTILWKVEGVGQTTKILNLIKIEERMLLGKYYGVWLIIFS